MFNHVFVRHTRSSHNTSQGDAHGSAAPYRRDVVTPSASDGDPRLSTFKALVESHANSIAEDLERGQQPWPPIPLVDSRRKSAGHQRFRPNPREQDALLEYNRIEVGAQRSFAQAISSARLGTLVLEEFYKPAPRLKQPYADLIATMLAARAEVNGRVYLNSIEGDHIATALERTGKALLSAGMPNFAEQAFNQAAGIHAKFKNSRAEDRCEYLKSDAHCKTHLWWTPRRLIWALSGILFGYGYKPLRLLIWMVVVIAGFAVYMLHLPREGDATRGDALYMAIQNFVNPMGLGDTHTISPHWEHALEVETYTGEILRNIFFVLLIRKWFRL